MRFEHFALAIFALVGPEVSVVALALPAHTAQTSRAVFQPSAASRVDQLELAPRDLGARENAHLGHLAGSSIIRPQK
jgi:hypothetical protein